MFGVGNMSDNSTDGPSPVKKIKRSDSNNEQSNGCKEGEKNVLSSSEYFFSVINE